VRLTRGFQKHPAGSVLVEFGETKVLCAARHWFLLPVEALVAPQPSADVSTLVPR